MALDMGSLYARLAVSGESDFGLLPLMAGCCDGQIGALNAESYAERVNSAAKLIANTGNSNLCDEDIERLTVLRMNRDFTQFMRLNYFAEIKAAQPFNKTVI